MRTYMAASIITLGATILTMLVAATRTNRKRTLINATGLVMGLDIAQLAIYVGLVSPSPYILTCSAIAATGMMAALKCGGGIITTLRGNPAATRT